MSNYETAVRGAGVKTVDREQTLNDVINRTQKRADDLLTMAHEVKSKLYRCPMPEPTPTAQAVGMIGDVDHIEDTLRKVHEVLSVVSERLA